MSDLLPFRVEPAEIVRIGRFLAVGLLNTIVGYGIFVALALLGMSAELALLIATIIGVAFNFITNRQLVFAGKGLERLPRFVAVYVGIYLVNAAILRAVSDYGYNPVYAQFIIMPIAVCTSYVAMRLYVFPEKKT